MFTHDDDDDRISTRFTDSIDTVGQEDKNDWLMLKSNLIGLYMMLRI